MMRWSSIPHSKFIFGSIYRTISTAYTSFLIQFPLFFWITRIPCNLAPAATGRRRHWNGTWTGVPSNVVGVHPIYPFCITGRFLRTL